MTKKKVNKLSAFLLLLAVSITANPALVHELLGEGNAKWAQVVILIAGFILNFFKETEGEAPAPEAS
jgi:hypothetical protein